MLNSIPFSLQDIDPETDIFVTTVNETDTDDANAVVYDSPENGSLWYVEGRFNGVPIGDGDFNDGMLSINDGTFEPEPGDSGFIAGKRIADEDTSGNNTVSTYVDGTEYDRIEVGVYFPNAASYDYYSGVSVTGVAVRLRRGHALEPKAFSPNQAVQTFDGTTEVTASFSAPTVVTDDTRTYYTHFYDDSGDGQASTADYVMDIPEYTDADNPVFSFEVKRTGGESTSWPTTFTELSESGSLPQSDNQSTWPITAYLEGNDEVPAPSGNGVITYYDVRGVIWEAGAKEATKTYSTNTVEISASDAGDLIQ